MVLLLYDTLQEIEGSMKWRFIILPFASITAIAIFQTGRRLRKLISPKQLRNSSENIQLLDLNILLLVAITNQNHNGQHAKFPYQMFFVNIQVNKTGSYVCLFWLSKNVYTLILQIYEIYVYVHMYTYIHMYNVRNFTSF